MSLPAKHRYTSTFPTESEPDSQDTCELTGRPVDLPSASTGAAYATRVPASEVVVVVAGTLVVLGIAVVVVASFRDAALGPPPQALSTSARTRTIGGIAFLTGSCLLRCSSGWRTKIITISGRLLYQTGPG